MRNLTHTKKYGLYSVSFSKSSLIFSISSDSFVVSTSNNEKNIWFQHNSYKNNINYLYLWLQDGIKNLSYSYKNQIKIKIRTQDGLLALFSRAHGKHPLAVQAYHACRFLLIIFINFAVISTIHKIYICTITWSTAPHGSHPISSIIFCMKLSSRLKKC